MPRNPKIITKEDVLRAMRVTKSNRQASRFLGVYHQTYKKYAKTYFDPETGKSLYDLHSNKDGKGIPKRPVGGTKDIPLNRLLNGVSEFPNYSLSKLKYRLIHEHILPEECCDCGFKEQRITDYKVPLMINFIDGNRFNWGKENLQFLCYNCYFLKVGDIFGNKHFIESDDMAEDKKIESDVWEMDENMKNHFKDLGLLIEGDDEDNPMDFTDYNS